LTDLHVLKKNYHQLNMYKYDVNINKKVG